MEQTRTSLIPSRPEGWGINELLEQKRRKEQAITLAIQAIAAAEADIKLYNEILTRRNT